MAMKSEINFSVMATMTAISGLLLLVVVFGVEAWFHYQQDSEMEALWDASPNVWLNDLRSRQERNLVNLEEAKKSVIEEATKKPA